MVRRTNLRLNHYSWAAWAGLFAILTLARPVYAQAAATGAPGDAKQEAKAHFKAGQTHYNLNENVEALGEFKAAYRLFPDPVFLYNLAQCERRLGHYEEAIIFYRSYLREQPQAPNRAEVQRKIDEMEVAQKSKDGESEERPAATSENPAKPNLAPSADAPSTGEPREPEPTPPAATPVADKPPQAIPLPAVAPEQPLPLLDVRPSSTPSTDPPPSSAFYQRWWFWTAVGVVAAGAAVGITVMAGQGSGAGPSTALGSRKVF